MQGNENVSYFAETDRFAFSVITKLELLGKFNIEANEAKILTEMLSWGQIFELDEQIEFTTIQLKQRYRLKLPDAIIAATAIENKLPLVSADKGFAQIEELDFIQIDL